MNLPRNAQLWLPGYVRCLARRRPRPAARVWLTIADHFEPLGGAGDEGAARERTARWSRAWPAIARRHRDATGKPPAYTFFYPEEEYRPALLDPLAEMSAAGIAGVEIHLHHDAESERKFVDRICRFKEILFARHGLLRKSPWRKKKDEIVFGFIHGNWALDNSLPGGRWCGLNNEISLLRDLGCYADFTLPSAPSGAQTRLVNTIYWALDDPARPKSHDAGIPLRAGKTSSGDLLMIPGPLALDWRRRKYGLFPRLETGELAAGNPVSRERVRLWLRFAPRIGGDQFIKLFAHGARERHARQLLGRDLDLLFRLLREECSKQASALRYATAWEMRNAVRAAHLASGRESSRAADIAMARQ